MPLREQEGLRSDLDLSPEGCYQAVPRGSSTCEEGLLIYQQIIRLDLLGTLSLYGFVVSLRRVLLIVHTDSKSILSTSCCH